MTRATASDAVLNGATPTSGDSSPTEPVALRIDAWWASRLASPRRRLWQWAGPVAVTLLAAVLRLWNLGTPNSLVFDETYYVKDAYSMSKLGYEGQWPSGADVSFNSGTIDIFTSQGAYIAHPPLGKWIISLGMPLFGAESPVGWRFSTAIVGVLTVALVCAIAFLLFRSTVLATIAGFLMAIDGLAIVMSRTALLDNSLLLFTLLGFGAVLLDREQSAARLSAWLASRADAGRSTDWGPALFWRPWLIAAGLLFGLATSVKWSGAYFLAAFAIYSLVVDAVARKRAGVRFWASSTALRQAPVSFLLLIPIAAVTYLASWTGWLVTQGGYGRQWANLQEAAGSTTTDRIIPWIPNALQSLWNYQVAIYNTNIGLSTPHAYQANPLGWLLLIRPTAFFYRGSATGENGCPFDSCAEYVTSIANPILWWLAVAAMVYLVYRLIRFREWQVGLILTGIAAGYLPWLLYTERTVFQFYTVVFLPYLVLGLTLALGLILGKPSDTRRRRLAGILIVAIVLGVIAAVSAFFWSAWSGMIVPGWYQQLHYWLRSWP